jgi:hypothetical protein
MKLNQQRVSSVIIKNENLVSDHKIFRVFFISILESCIIIRFITYYTDPSEICNIRLLLTLIPTHELVKRISVSAYGNTNSYYL